MRGITSLLEFFLYGFVRSLAFFSLFQLLFATWFTVLGGGVWLYGQLLAPFLVKNEGDIDKGLLELTRSVSNRASSLAGSVRTKAAELLVHMVVKEAAKQTSESKDSS